MTRTFFGEDYWGALDSGVYRPFGLLVLYYERAAFGTQPWPSHLVSLLLHCGTTLLLLDLLAAILLLTSFRLFASEYRVLGCTRLLPELRVEQGA